MSRPDEVRLIEEVIRLTSYHEGEGTLTWLPRALSEFKTSRAYGRWNTVNAGKQAGSLKNRGYLLVRCMGVQISVHRVIFFVHHGFCPKQIDHINGIRTDNRISNLRAATGSQNCMNRGLSSRNTSGHKGVRLNRSTGRWTASITVKRKPRNLGSFENLEDALAARRLAVLELHGDFARLEN